MMKERKYLAVADDGHDYGEFEFYSSHRNNSNGNISDAKRESVKKYGSKRASKLTIVQTHLISD